MKENLAIITQADEPMVLTNQDLGNPTSRGPAARISPRRLARTFRRILTSCAVEIFSAHAWPLSIRGRPGAALVSARALAAPSTNLGPGGVDTECPGQGIGPSLDILPAPTSA